MEAFKVSWGLLQLRVHRNNIEKGFWSDEDKANSRDIKGVGLRLALVHSELSEALEAARKHYPESEKISYGNFEEELADAVIRIMDISASMGIPLGKVILEKIEYNKGRSFRHGGKSA